MSTYKELKKDFNKKVKELQENCKHTDVSDWLKYYWAIAHWSGAYVKKCNICNKIVDEK